jgi:hypothetical protein
VRGEGVMVVQSGEEGFIGWWLTSRVRGSADHCPRP